MTVQQTSIDCYYQHVIPNLIQPQQQRILNVMHPSQDYSLSELSMLTGMDKSAVSARVNAMKHGEILEHAPQRKCSITNKRVNPVCLPKGQCNLF